MIKITFPPLVQSVRGENKRYDCNLFNIKILSAMADPSLTRAINPANALRLLAAACDNIRVLESELHQSYAAQHRVSPADLAILKKCLRLRDKLLPAGGGLRASRWVAGRYRVNQGRHPLPRWIANRGRAPSPELPLASNAAPRIHFLLVGDASAAHNTTRSILEQTDPHWRLWTAIPGRPDSRTSEFRPLHRLGPSPLRNPGIWSWSPLKTASSPSFTGATG